MCKPAMLRDTVIALCWMKQCSKLLKVYTQKRKRIFHLTDAVHLLELYVEFVLLEHFLHKCTQKSSCDSHFWLKVICYYSSQTCAADWLPFSSPILSQLSSLGDVLCITRLATLDSSSPVKVHVDWLSSADTH